MAAPVGIASTNTSASFVFNNMAVTNGGAMYSSNSNNTNSVVAQPNVQALDFQSATFMAARQAGGVSYRAPSNSAFTSATNTNAAIVMIDNMETATSHLGYRRNGCFMVVTNATAVVVPLTNTQTNTNSFAGDTVFNTNSVYQALFYNLSGLDGNNGVAATILCNGSGAVNIIGGSAGTVVPASSRQVYESIAGVAVNSANSTISINSATPCTVAVVISAQ